MINRLIFKISLLSLLLLTTLICKSFAFTNQPAQLSTLMMQEKQYLEDTVLKYDKRIFEIQEELINLKMKQEWVILRIERISDQTRKIPSNLKETLNNLIVKINSLKLEQKRLQNLMSQHIDRLKSLEEKIQQIFPYATSMEWSLDPRIKQLLHPEAIKSDEKSENSLSQKSNLQKELEQKIWEYGLENWVELIEENSILRLENRLPILFAPGKTYVAKDYKNFFQKLAQLIKSYPVNIEIQGFADSSKIKSSKFPSNWELGASRASSVMREIIKQGIDPSVFRVVSRGQYGDIIYDKDSKSKAMSRRVEITVFFKDTPLTTK